MRHWIRTCVIALAAANVSAGLAADPSSPASASEAISASSVTFLPDGRKLILGGVDASGKVTNRARVVSPEIADGQPLSAHLRTARSGHTASVLPNGKVVILGGVGVDGRVAKTVELFDPKTEIFELVSYPDLLARTDHTATVMTDGRILVAGGIGEDGRVLREVEVLDTRAGAVERIDPKLETARFGHIAALMPSSPVLVWGGFDHEDRALQSAELYNPVTGEFIAVRPGDLPALQGELTELREPAISGSIPVPGAVDFPIDAMLSIRFSKRLQMPSLNEQSVVLFGPMGVSKAKVVPAEGGMLVFITPEADLQPGAYYTLFLSGPMDSKGARLPFSAVGFRTAIIGASYPGSGIAAASSSSRSSTRPNPGSASTSDGQVGSAKKDSLEEDEEEWIPGPEHFNGNWRTHRKPPSIPKVTKQRAAEGVTALSGLVLRLNGKPLVNATLAIGNRRAVTDESGHFLLADVPAGSQTLVIEGQTANRPGATYGYFESLVSVAPGRTNELPYTIWVPKLDTQHTLKIPSPTTEEVVLSTPRIPGFEVRIPAGVVLRDRSGKIVTEIGITALPIDRTPFPQPSMEFPVYYTVQPGGVMVQSVDGNKIRPAELVYPNYTNAQPGTRTNAWLYDPFEKGWYIYGHGVVSPDRSKILLEPGVGIYEFTGSAHAFGPSPGPPGPPPCNCPNPPTPDDPGRGGFGSGGASGVGGAGNDSAGDPVSLSTGVFMYAETDLTVTDITPLSVLRVYRHNGPNRGLFGYGWSTPLDWYLWMPGDQSKIVLVLPNGSQVDYNLISGTGYGDGSYLHTGSPSQFYGSTLQSAGAAYWRLIFKDGHEYNFDLHNAKVTAFSDRYGNTTHVARDLPGNITRLTGPTGRWLAFTLNFDGTVSQLSDVTGRTVSYAYQGGYLQSVTDPAGGVRGYTYDANNRLRTVTDPMSNVVVTNDYDANGRVATQTYANNATMQFAYTLDANGKVTQANVTDQRGNVRQVNFNAKGFITSSTYPFGKPEQQTTTFNRDATSGLVNSMTDALNRTTSYTYDNKGNVTSVTRLSGTPDAVTTSYTYEPYFNQLATVTDPLNHTWTYGFDTAHNPITLTDPLGHVTTWAFNGRGQVSSVTDALNHAWTYTYNGAVLATVTDPLNGVTQSFADTLGRVIFAKDEIGQVSRLEYDGMSRRKKITDALSGTVQFGFDLAGNLTSHKDKKNNSTTYSYNNLNLVAGKTDALTNTETYLYGANGKVSQITDRKGQVTGITYDNLNRMSQVGFGATVTALTAFASSIAYTYDSGNRVTQIADSVGGTIMRTHDGLDRLTQEVTPEGTVTYTYDNAGRRATMAVTGQGTVNYTFDNANHLTQIAQGSDTIGFAYDNANRRTSTTLANGVVMAYGYDNGNQLASITYTKGATTIGDLQYTYDAAGRRTKVSGSLAATDLPAAVASAIYNANNQLTSWGGATHTYDLNGNLTSNGTNAYAWDARDQLSGISGGVTASFAYDGTGRRKSKTIAGTQTGFVYDGVNFVQELAGGTPKASLITGGIDEVFLRRESTTTRHPITDALGSLIALTDSTGAVSTQYSFEPYGKATQSGAADTNSQSYTGREDDRTGLAYFRARYLLTNSGRFASEDPAGTAAGSNPYIYVGADPINFADPSGMYRCTYSIGARTMQCSPDDPGHGNFSSSQFVSGNNQSPSCSDCKNNSNRTNVPFHGPIPVGNYSIGPQLAGSSRRNLTPDPAGRNGFQTHGCGNPETCSEGCIAATTNAIRDLFNQRMHLEEGHNTLNVTP